MDEGNLRDQIALMDLPYWAENQIRDHVEVGYRAKAPGGVVSQDEWSGVGYVFWKDTGCAAFLLQGEINGGMTTEPFVWGGWNSFWMVECGWQEYYPDVGGEANAGIACGLCSTRVEWTYPPDSSVWAWGDSIAVARYDTLFWCEADTPEVLGPDTCLFYSGDYPPDIFTLRAEVFGPYPPGSSNDPIWYFGGDSLRFWSVKVEVDEALSDRILDVPVAEGDSAEVPVKTVFRILPDEESSEASFVGSPAANDVTYWHSVSYGPGSGDEVVVKAEEEFILGTLPFSDNRYTLEWEQKDHSANWLDPVHNPYTSRVEMRWERGETRQPVEARGEVECGASGVDLVVKLSLPPPYLDELPEEDEEGEGRGMLVRLNDDHDAGSDQPDWQLNGPIEEEDDLVHVEVRISEELLAEHPMGATVELEVSGAGRRQVEVWGAKEKGGDRFLLGGYGPYEKSWQLDLSADVEELGPLLERGIWIEGFERASSRLRDWKLEARVGVGERGARDIVEGTVLRVDLVVTGLAEEDEVEVGCFVPYNHDDDNCNNQQDREEVGPVVFNQQVPGSQNEDNLVHLGMRVEPFLTGGGLRCGRCLTGCGFGVRQRRGRVIELSSRGMQRHGTWGMPTNGPHTSRWRTTCGWRGTRRQSRCGMPR